MIKSTCKKPLNFRVKTQFEKRTTFTPETCVKNADARKKERLFCPGFLEVWVCLKERQGAEKLRNWETPDLLFFRFSSRMTVLPSPMKYNENEKTKKQNNTEESFQMALAVGPQETKQKLTDGGQLQTVVPESGKRGMQRAVSAE